MIVVTVVELVRIIMLKAVRSGAIIVSEVHEEVIEKLKVDDSDTTELKFVIEQVNNTDWVPYGPG